MFIKNRNQYLISENLKQARQYLIKKGVSLDLPMFQHIVNSLKKTPNLIDTFTRMVFSDDVISNDNNHNHIMTEFDRISNWIKSNKNILNQLPKNIIEYKSLEELSDDITQLEHDRKIHKFIKSLYRSMRDEVSKLSDEDREKFDDLAISFMNLSDLEKSQFTPLKYFEKNNISIHEFMDSLDKFINGQDVNDNKKRVYDYIKGNNKLDVVYDKDDVLVIQTNDGESVCELGSQKWCIVYAPNSYQKQYFGENTMNTQYIIYNFNLPSSSRYSMFGVTIDKNGNVIPGGSQDKMNGFNSLDKIYELTGIPEGTLKSVYKELFDELSFKLSTATVNSDYTDILRIREISLKLNADKIRTKELSMKWLRKYYESEIHRGESMYNILKDVNIKVNELHIPLDDKLSNLKDDYIRSILNDINIDKNIPISVNIAEIKRVIKEFKELGLDTIYLLGKIFTWLSNDFSNDAENMILIINEIIEDDYIKSIDIKKTIKSLVGSNVINNSILKFIPKNIDSIVNFYIDNKKLIRSVDIKMTDVISNLDSPTLSEIVYLLGIDIFYISNYDRTIDVDAHSRYYENLYENMLGKIDINLNQIDGISELISNINSICGKLYDIITRVGKSIIDINSLNDLYHKLVYIISHDYMNVDKRNSINEIISGYSKLKDYMGDDYYYFDEYVYSNLNKMFHKFYKNESELSQWIIELSDSGIIEPYQLIDDANNLEYDKSSEFFKFIGKILVDTETKVRGTSFYMYCKGLYDDIYMDEFLSSIGLKYHTEYKEWYLETSYSDLPRFFDGDIDFDESSFLEYSFYDEYNYHNDITDEININNLSLLSKYFFNNGFEIDISPLDKYDLNKDYSYTESNSLYREDRDLKVLLDSTIDIIKMEDPDDESYKEIDIKEIQNAIDIAFAELNNMAIYDKYIDQNLENLGDEILEVWPDWVNSFGGSYFTIDKSDNLLMIPNLNELLYVEESYDRISYICGLEDIDIDCIIDGYFEDNDKVSVSSVPDYVSFSNNNYDHLSDMIRDRLLDTAVGSIDENIEILTLSDYNLLLEKRLSELNNPSRFLSEFNDNESAIEDLNFYSDTLDKLNKDGGEVYRLVFLENISDLDTSNLGHHWCLELSQLSNFYNSLDDQIGLPYLITGYLEPNQIDLKSSFSVYEELPHELEVNLLSDPIRYNIEPYKNTYKSKYLWENILH